MLYSVKRHYSIYAYLLKEASDEIAKHTNIPNTQPQQQQNTID